MQNPHSLLWWRHLLYPQVELGSFEYDIPPLHKVGLNFFYDGITILSSSDSPNDQRMCLIAHRACKSSTKKKGFIKLLSIHNFQVLDAKTGVEIERWKVLFRPSNFSIHFQSLEGQAWFMLNSIIIWSRRQGNSESYVSCEQKRSKFVVGDRALFLRYVGSYLAALGS